MEDSLDIGQRVRLARERHGWSLRFLASKTGLSPSFLSDLEGGKRNPSAGNVVILCRALNITPDWLLGFDVGPIPPEPTHAAQALTEALREVAALRDWKFRVQKWYVSANKAILEAPPGEVECL
jgi:transcriptional regulator with XRE-family HTH domain